MQAEPTLLTREQLHQLVWNEPGAHLAKRFGLSDTGLAKSAAGSTFHDRRPRTNIGVLAPLDDAVETFNSTVRRTGKTIVRVRS
jgi:hypothetical protein